MDLFLLFRKEKLIRLFLRLLLYLLLSIISGRKESIWIVLLYKDFWPSKRRFNAEHIFHLRHILWVIQEPFLENKVIVSCYQLRGTFVLLPKIWLHKRYHCIILRKLDKYIWRLFLFNIFSRECSVDGLFSIWFAIFLDLFEVTKIYLLNFIWLFVQRVKQIQKCGILYLI